MKPRIYWHWYPKSKRGYWRVSPIKRHAPTWMRNQWAYAHRMCRQMNEQDHDKDCERAVST
jgi:hypothetical protein